MKNRIINILLAILITGIIVTIILIVIKYGRNQKKEKDVLAGWINKQLNSKNKADKKEWKNQKRNLIPKPEKLTAKERGIVQWIARFESGYRRKRIGTRFFGVWE